MVTSWLLETCSHILSDTSASLDSQSTPTVTRTGENPDSVWINHTFTITNSQQEETGGLPNQEILQRIGQKRGGWGPIQYESLIWWVNECLNSVHLRQQETCAHISRSSGHRGVCCPAVGQVCFLGESVMHHIKSKALLMRAGWGLHWTLKQACRQAALDEASLRQNVIKGGWREAPAASRTLVLLLKSNEPPHYSFK